MRRHEDLSIIQRVYGNGLHLKGLNQSQSVRVHEIITTTLVVGKRLLLELNDQVAGVGTERLVTLAFIYELSLFRETREDTDREAISVDHVTICN